MRVAVLGSSGMLGSMVCKVLEADPNIELIKIEKEQLNAETATLFDIRNALQGAVFVINCMGILNKYIDEEDSESVERAIRVNSIFPHMLAKTGLPVVQIATDCAGEPDVYGLSKKLGEVKAPLFANIRCSIIGPGNKDGLFDWFLAEEKMCKGFTNHYWNGVTTLAFAKMCLGLTKSSLRVDAFNFTNFVPYKYVSKNMLLGTIKEIFGKDIEIVPVDAPKMVNRVLPDTMNTQGLWQVAGYDRVPKIYELVQELKDYMKEDK